MSEDERLNMPDAGDHNDVRPQRCSAIWCFLIVILLVVAVLIISLVLRNQVAGDLPDDVNIAPVAGLHTREQFLDEGD